MTISCEEEIKIRFYEFFQKDNEYMKEIVSLQEKRILERDVLIINLDRIMMQMKQKN